MRFLLLLAAPLGLLLVSAEPAAAQDKDKPKFILKMHRVRIGFQPYNMNDPGQFKIGMWTPVYVEVEAGQKGLPIKTKDDRLQVQAFDSEGVGTFYNEPWTEMKPGEIRTLVSYAKPGTMNFNAAKVETQINWDDRTFTGPPPNGNALMTFGGQIYLTLGARMNDLRTALVSLARGGQLVNEDDINVSPTGARSAVYETDVNKLPTLWFGYQALDMIILNTDKKEFLTNLANDTPRLAALAQWVRRGGRLVIPVHYANQELVYNLLKKPQAWKLEVPVIPPANPGDIKESAVKRLVAIEQFAQAQLKPFPPPGKDPVPIARLAPPNLPPGAWEVSAATEDGRPLIARVPYGLGSVTYIAFSLDQPPFSKWEGRVDFLRKLITDFAPRFSQQQDQFGKGMWFDGQQGFDLTTELQRQLDNNFDVNVVPFGYVALFIILYILVVGPLDYFVLKYVFNKLEWTWVTFPAIVLAVSIAAYFTAYALKGNDLKINKVDIVDFDLRTDLDGELKPGRTYAYGQSFFALLSPRIQNYTVGVEPNGDFWGARQKNPLSADMVSWLGRPEFDGPGGMGASRSQGFFRRPYTYAEDAQGLVGVPIPVWTTKSFTASWEAPLPKPPLEIDLSYSTKLVEGRDIRLSGTIKNNLPVDLETAWVFYSSLVFPIKGGLPSGKAIDLALEYSQHKDMREEFVKAQQVEERDVNFQSVQGQYNPTYLVKQALFFEKIDQGSAGRNFSLRGLDQSWRLREIPPAELKNRKLTEGVLYARVKFRRGSASSLTTDPANPLPTNLWLGALPGSGEPMPSLQGQMAQDTFVRILFAVKASPNN